MFYYPNDFFTVLENELKCRMVFFRALRMEQKTCGFLLLIGDLFFSFDLFPPLNYRVGSDTSDRHPRLSFYRCCRQKTKTGQKTQLVKGFSLSWLMISGFLKKCWMLSSYHTSATTTASLTLLYFTTQPKKELTVRKTSREDCHWRFYIQSGLCLLLRFPLSSPPLFTFELLPKYLCSTGSKTQSHVPSAYKWEEHLELERRLGMKPGRKKRPNRFFFCKHEDYASCITLEKLKLTLVQYCLPFLGNCESCVCSTYQPSKPSKGWKLNSVELSLQRWLDYEIFG